MTFNTHLGLRRILARARLGRAIKAGRQFCARRDGVSAIEFAFVVPFLVLLFTGIIQLGGIFFVHHNMTAVAQESARLVAVGELTTDDVESFATGRLVGWNITYAVNAQASGGDVTVTISAPYAEASLVDILGFFQTGNLSSQATMRII